MAMLILLVLLIVFAALGVPLAFAIGASCVTYITTNAPTFLGMLPQRVWNGAFSELMIAMPLFMLAGELMNTGGITQRIIDFCMEILRPVRGGLGEVNIVASMMITGLAIGLVTPPVGMCLNACNKINRMPIVDIFKGAAPYVVCNVLVLLAISLWAPLTTWLPTLLGYSLN